MSRKTLYVLLTCVVILWGTSFAVTKIGIKSAGAIEFLCMRLFFSSCIFCLILIFLPKQKTKVDIKDVPYLIYLAFIGVGGYFIVQYSALKLTTSVNASLILATAPIFIVIYSIFAYKERLSVNKILGISLCFVGVIFIISKGQMNVISFSKTIKGDIIMLLNAIMLAGFSLGAKRILNKYDSFVAIAYIHILGFIIVLLFAIIPNKLVVHSMLKDFSYINSKNILAALYLGITCSVFGYAVWYKAIKEIGATRTSVFNYINPLVASLTSFILFDEGINVFTVVGGVCIISGVTLINTKFTKKITAE